MDSKISNLTLVTALDGADVLPIVNGGSTKKVTVTKIQEGLATTTYVDSQDATKENALGNPSTNGYVLSSSTAGVRTWVAQGGGVPYSGATANVDLGEFELKAGQLALDTTPTGTPSVGVTQWNDSLGSSQTTLKGGTVVLKNGVDLVARIVNKVTPNTTLTKANYQAVRVSGATGQRLSVQLAQGDADLNSADTIGLVTETIATNQEGFIITMGQLENINTTGSLQSETWADGDVLYLSPTVAGRLTNIKPTGATGHIVVIGYVEYAHANNGKIYVKIMNGWELDELHNVFIDNTLANEDFLQYESSSDLWKNKPLTDTLIKSKLGITTLSGSNTGDNAVNTLYSGLATSKQDTLQSTVNIKSINGNSLLGSGDLVISGGGAPPQSAYTVLANNTNASAVPTEQGFRNEITKAYAGATPTWTGTTAPSGTTNHTYSWNRIGNVVILRVSLDYTTAGTSISQVTFDLPSDCPSPELPSGVSANADVISYGSGMLSANRNVPAAPTAAYSCIRIKSSGVYEINIGRGTAASHRYAYATIQYFV